nr:invasion associated locus B family protein [Alphaproteobacteria bacterium]
GEPSPPRARGAEFPAPKVTQWGRNGLEYHVIKPYVVTMSKIILVCATLVVLLAATISANATKPRGLLKNPGAWGAFSLNEGKGLACYLAGQPKDSKPIGVKRGPVWLLVTHRPYKKIEGEIGVYVGYPLKGRSTVTIDIDRQKFKLYTVDDTAWVEDAKMEAKLVAAMRKGRRMVIKGTSKRGTNTTDTYSLNGFTRAHLAINRACKVK